MQVHSRGRTYLRTRWRRVAGVLATCVVVALLWRTAGSSRSAGQGTAASTATEAGDTGRGFARVLERDGPLSVQERGRQKQSPQQVIAEAGEAARREPVKAVNLDPRPNIRRWSGNPDEKFLAYLPHSGYHNQRISLENAIALAKLLDRTLLVPPVWLGHSIPYISFDKLYDRVTQARKTGLEHCRDVAPYEPIPQECLGGYWDYTVVSWDFLVNLTEVAQVQSLVERWDMSYAWLDRELGIKTDRPGDIAYTKDAVLYEYRIFDDAQDTTGLDKFQKRLNVDDLKRDYADHRLLHLGTVFGSTRLHLRKPESRAIHTLAKKSMVFRNPYLDRLSDAISARLGGPLGYLGLHIRLGDGIFQKNALANAEKMFDDLCLKKLGLSLELVDGLKEESRRVRGHGQDDNVPRTGSRSWGMGKRDLLPPADSATEPGEAGGAAQAGPESKRGLRGREDPHLILPPLRTIYSLADSTLHKSLSCRGLFHSDPRLLHLNTPIFLATDSKIPTSDPALRLFFNTFPCIFVLADFLSGRPTDVNSEPLELAQELGGLVNSEDGVGLAGFFYPLIDAMVASKGRDMLGTSGSTFSHFATDVLHNVYHEWPIIERG